MKSRFDAIEDNRYDAIMNAAVGIGEGFQDMIMSRANGEGWTNLERDALAKEALTIVRQFFNV